MKQKICYSIINSLWAYTNEKVFDKRISVKLSQVAEKQSFFVSLKEFFKKSPKLYLFLTEIISPVYLTYKVRTRLLKKYLSKNSIILNIASGNIRLHDSIINVDLFNYPAVDVVSDATNLCFKDCVADLIINEASLHHIYEFKKVVSETFRILKYGGEAYFIVPFMAGFHESPCDFHRFTHEGLMRLFTEHGFSVKEIGLIGGPASSFTWILIEFLSILLCFNSVLLYRMWFFIFTLILWPIKFLDFFLNRISFSKQIACTFYIVAEK